MIGFMSGVIAAVAAFGAYEYTAHEADKTRQLETAQQALAAERQAAVDASALTLRRGGEQPNAQRSTPSAPTSVDP